MQYINYTVFIATNCKYSCIKIYFVLIISPTYSAYEGHPEGERRYTEDI